MEIYRIRIIKNLVYLKMKKTNLLLIVSISLIVLVARLVPHMPNFSPLGSVLLFAGVYAKNKKYIFIPLIALFISDLFLGFYKLEIMLSVYISLLLIALAGRLIKKNKNILNITTASMGSAILFFLATNFAVWYFGEWYPHTWAGLSLSYSMGIPFFKSTLMSNIIYTTFLFGTYESIQYFYKQKAFAKSR